MHAIAHFELDGADRNVNSNRMSAQTFLTQPVRRIGQPVHFRLVELY